MEELDKRTRIPAAAVFLAFLSSSVVFVKGGMATHWLWGVFIYLFFLTELKES